MGGVGIAASTALAAYQMQQQKKAAAKAAQAAGNVAGNGLQSMDFGQMPAYIPADYWGINKEATNMDKVAYAASDQDFKKRHPELLAGEKDFEHQTALDQKGDQRFMPQMQAEAINSGLGSTLDAFGDQGPSTGIDSAGQARIAQNLGISIMGFQDRNRANAQKSLSLAEQIFPRRQLGLGGGDAAQILLGNVTGQNAFNQANYASKVGQQQFNEKIAAGNQANQISQANAQAQANATLSAAQAQTYAGMANTALTAGGQAYGNYQAAHPVAPTPRVTTTSATARV